VRGTPDIQIIIHCTQLEKGRIKKGIRRRKDLSMKWLVEIIIAYNKWIGLRKGNFLFHLLVYSLKL
jgi:hypothetical protein